MELLSKEKIIKAAKEFLDVCGWSLELEDNEIVAVPKDMNLVVATRTYVNEDLTGYTWGNHYQARVLLDPDENGIAKFGTLVLYLGLNGEIISEDHGRYI